MFDKAKLMLSLATPSMQRRISLLSSWFGGLINAISESGVKIDAKVENQEDMQTVLLELLRKAKISSIEGKNALILELGEQKKVRLILSFKVVDDGSD